jgi:hypothetical protein
MYDLALLFHILLLTYWLGADLGVFYSSRYVMRTDISTESRNVALKIMGWLDLWPRLCLVLFLPSGVTLMALDDYGRDTFMGWPLVGIWVAGAIWFALVLGNHYLHDHPKHALIAKLDLLARSSVVVGLLGSAAYTVLVDEPFGVTTNPKWLGFKVGLYAIAIGCGIAIRFKLRPFTPAWIGLMTKGSSGEVEAGIRASIVGSQPYVAAIWVCVVGAALLGLAKPGATL